MTPNELVNNLNTVFNDGVHFSLIYPDGISINVIGKHKNSWHKNSWISFCKIFQKEPNCDFSNFYIYKYVEFTDKDINISNYIETLLKLEKL